VQCAAANRNVGSVVVVVDARSAVLVASVRRQKRIVLTVYLR
jgi:pantothenate kinase type III